MWATATSESFIQFLVVIVAGVLLLLVTSLKSENAFSCDLGFARRTTGPTINLSAGPTLRTWACRF